MGAFLLVVGSVGDELDNKGQDGGDERGDDREDHVGDPGATRGPVDEVEQVEDAEAARDVHESASHSHDSAAHGGAQACHDERALVGEGDAVDARLGDAEEEGGDHRGKGDAAEALVLVSEVQLIGVCGA